jgi:pyruvate formate lyase activating enzyme
MIRGITETSFLDWDGKVVTVLYTARCNLRCPFCHNWQLMKHPEKYPEKNWPFIETYLKEHQDFLDGVCITGGEPTLESGLEALIRKIRGLNLGVKLDTNGTRPEVIARLLEKAPLDGRYSKATGVEPDLGRIKKAIRLLMESGIEHEFRTTVVPTLHSEGDVVDIAKELKGAKKYVLQQFVPGNTWAPELRDVKPYDNETILEMAQNCRKHVDEVVVRGLR